MRSLLAVLFVCAAGAAHTVAASPVDQELRATVERFVAAQNAHDLSAVGALLLDSPNFLWITRGTPVWGRSDALNRFQKLYAGTWHLEPDWAALRIVVAEPHVAEIFVPIAFNIGAPEQQAQETQILMNMVLTKQDKNWKVASILPIPIPPPSK
jgi:ketosteroid isomerase-like protein